MDGVDLKCELSLKRRNQVDIRGDKNFRKAFSVVLSVDAQRFYKHKLKEKNPGYFCLNN